MKIVIIGCGKVGETLASVLSQEGNDITIIDKEEEIVDRLCNQYDIMGCVGNGATFSVQSEADIEHADLMIAVTGMDELNLLCCLIARKAGKAGCHTIARIRNPEYNKELRYIQAELGLAYVINQEFSSAMEISQVMKFPSAIEIDSFSKGRVELLRFKIPVGSVLDGLNLIDMHARLKCNVLVCTAERAGEVVIPRGDYILKSGDVISIVAASADQNLFFKKIGIHTNQVKSVLIIGGSRIAFYLSQMLLSAGIKVKIIEKNKERCELFSEHLPKAVIIHGDGTDQQLLKEEGISSVEGLVALTGLDEENIMVSLYARMHGVRKVVTKINHISFDEVINSLDLDTLIYPREITAESILQYVRAMKNSMGSNVETLHRMNENKVEALEFLIRENFSRKNTPLQELPLRQDVLVACISRSGRIILPRGHDVLEPGDSVIVVTTRLGLNDISEIFTR